MSSSLPDPRRKLRILLTVDPYLPVPPVTYGGIERVADFLARGLAARGHSVTLLAHPDSVVDGVALLTYGAPPHFSRLARARELWQVGTTLWNLRGRTDVIHSFGRLAALVPVLPRRRLAKLQSYQRDGVPWASVRVAQALGGSSLRFTGCSSSVYRHPSGSPAAGRWSTVFNGVDVAKYQATRVVPDEAPLAFLGRLEPLKGVHHAIAIARLASRRLIIAGNRVETGEAQGYFEREIAPHIDGENVRWIGAVDDPAKNELLGSAAALLLPVEWDEPFGIVMVEAMACGTPVIAFRRGSVPEVVSDGHNGFSCRTVEEAARAVQRLREISRIEVRRDAELRFGADTIVEQYLEIYYELLGPWGR